jgi:hypothetical protein
MLKFTVPVPVWDAVKSTFTETTPPATAPIFATPPVTMGVAVSSALKYPLTLKLHVPGLRVTVFAISSLGSMDVLTVASSSLVNSNV